MRLTDPPEEIEVGLGTIAKDDVIAAQTNTIVSVPGKFSIIADILTDEGYCDMAVVEIMLRGK